MVYFISGHRDITPKEFNKLYVPVIQEVIENDEDFYFVVGDYWGVDELAQDWLKENLSDSSQHRVTVYHMFEKARVCKSNLFNQQGGFKDDESRDAAMTKRSDMDIAFVRKGKRHSGTAQNIVRRFEF